MSVAFNEGARSAPHPLSVRVLDVSVRVLDELVRVLDELVRVLDELVRVLDELVRVLCAGLGMTDIHHVYAIDDVVCYRIYAQRVRPQAI